MLRAARGPAGARQQLTRETPRAGRAGSTYPNVRTHTGGGSGSGVGREPGDPFEDGLLTIQGRGRLRDDLRREKMHPGERYTGLPSSITLPAS